jgi:hypothetical protein
MIQNSDAKWTYQAPVLSSDWLEEADGTYQPIRGRADAKL